MQQSGTLRTALEREHHEIDGGIEAYTAALVAPHPDPEPLERAMHALRRHIYLEERFLFPPLREAGMIMPVLVMLKEHGEIWNRMDDLDRLLDEGADSTTLLDACREMLALLERHNSKEEPVLYTRADDVLDEEAGAELRQFLASGRMPEGWVCEKA